MLTTRVIPALMIGALMTTSAFAATSEHHKASSVLTTEQIAAIQKECSQENAESMTTKAYQSCVKDKEDAAIAKTMHHKNQ